MPDQNSTIAAIKLVLSNRPISVAALFAALSLIVSYVGYVQTQQVGGDLSGSMPNPVVLTVNGYTPPNKAGDTITGPYLFNQTLGLPLVPTNVDLAYALTPANMVNALKFAAGNYVSIAPPLSCLSTSSRCGGAPTNDHQRTSALFASGTLIDNAAEEQTVAIIMQATTGAKTVWAAGASYAVGANIVSNGQAYRAATACTSGTTAPSGFGTGSPPQQSDGGCSWTWISSSAITTKLPLYVEQAAGAGAGFVEGATFNLQLQGPGYGGPFDVNQGARTVEIDQVNTTGTDCPLTKCEALSLLVGGSNSLGVGFTINGGGGVPKTGGGKRPTLQEAMRIVNGAAVNDDIYIGDSAINGILIGDDGFNGQPTHTSSFRDTSTSATSLDIAGTFTNGLNLGGTFSGAQILGKGGFILYPDGSLRIGNGNPAASITTGALQVPNGGASVGGNIYGGAQLNISGNATFGGNITENSTVLVATTLPFTNGAGSGAGTISNAPTAGNPTKWIPINDNGTIRYLPAW